MGRTAGVHDEIATPSDTQGEVTHTATGTIRERPTATTRDRFFISDAKKKAYGIQEDE